MRAKNAQKGAVLIIILILSSIVTIISYCIFNSANLQLKMSNNYAAHTKERKAEINKLKKIEKLMEGEWLEVLPSQVQFVQFIPDTLHLKDLVGTNYYKIHSGNLNSTIAVRSRSIESEVEALPPWFDKWKQTLPENTIINYPLFAALASNKQVIIVLSSLPINETHIDIFDIFTGELIKKMIYHDTGFFPITAVDLNQQSIVALLYLINNEGHLLKINLQSQNSNQWVIQYLGSYGTALQSVIVGCDQQGRGQLLYLHMTDRVVATLDNNNNLPTVIFEIPIHETSPIHLYQNKLVYNTDNALILHDAFSGKLISNIKHDLFYSRSVPDFQILIQKPYEIKRQIVFDSNLVGSMLVDIDNDYLGRRTWRELFHHA